MAPETATRRADVRQRATFGNRFRFLVRVLGLTGFVVAFFGFSYVLSYAPDPAGMTGEQAREAGRAVAQAAQLGELGQVAQIAMFAATAGLWAVAGVVVVELLGLLFLVAGRKTAAGGNVVVQMALAAALLVVVNLIAFGTYWRFDLTRDKQFTFAPQLIEDLRKLRADSPTTVVVLQLHKTAGTLSDKPDAYDYAAERKVVEKVRDLLDQLREFGPRFNVAVLDVEDEGYERAVKELTRTRPGLAEAIANAPENSIFFYADEKVRPVPRADADRLPAGLFRPATAPDPDDAGRVLVYPGAVTRLSFAEFYQLDKTSSKEATPKEREGAAALVGGVAFAPGVHGKGNLVLLPRGKEAFVRKVLALEERRPRVALAVIHPLLTSREEFDEYTAAGMRKALEANGFEVADVILKRWTRTGPPTPAAYTYEESELDRVESRYGLLNRAVAETEGTLNGLTEFRGRLDKMPLADLDRMFARQIGRRITTEADRQIIRQAFDENIQLRRELLTELNKALAEVGPRYQELLRTGRAAETRRLTDVGAKLREYVAGCDLLIVPRLTVVDIARGEQGVIPPSLFNVSKDQAEVVKEFLKAGKPVLFALGPTNVDRRGLGAEPAGDDVERLLPQLGIELGRQTVLTPAEAQAMAERQNDAFGSSVDVPPLLFDLPEKDGKKPNPVAAAFRVTARAVDRKLDVKKSGFRPVYPAPGAAARLPFAAEIMYTGPDSWNEDKPIPEDDSVPKFDPAKPDDPKKGTHDEERHGPLPVGVAVETKVPVDWFDPPADAVAALAGSPGAYSGPTGFGPGFPAAALALPFDGGLTAAALTVAADKVKRPTVRVVVLGHGGLFTGKRLDPGQETLLLDTVNWQLDRDDRLPHDVSDDQKWRFPRVDLSPREFRVWWLATLVGLPALTVYFGLIILMVRKVR